MRRAHKRSSQGQVVRGWYKVAKEVTGVCIRARGSRQFFLFANCRTTQSSILLSSIRMLKHEISRCHGRVLEARVTGTCKTQSNKKEKNCSWVRSRVLRESALLRHKFWRRLSTPRKPPSSGPPAGPPAPRKCKLRLQETLAILLRLKGPKDAHEVCLKAKNGQTNSIS